MDKRIVVEVAAPADAVAIRSVQAETWLATYPNARRGITYEGVRQRIEGLNGEKIGPKIESLRQRIRTAELIDKVNDLVFTYKGIPEAYRPF